MDTKELKELENRIYEAISEYNMAYIPLYEEGLSDPTHPDNQDMKVKVVSKLAQLIQSKVEAAEARVLDDFAEFCHTKYKGSAHDSYDDSFTYGYESEVTWMAEEYLKSKRTETTEQSN